MSDVTITVTAERCPSDVSGAVEMLHSQLLGSSVGMRALAFAAPAPNAGPRLLSFRRTNAAEYQATYYDYGNDEAIHVRSDVTSNELTHADTSAKQPLPTQAEFQAAVELLRQDSDLGPAVNSGQFQLYRPMPPISYEPSPTGRVPRILMVGLQPVEGSGLDAEIVGVRMANGAIVRFPSRAPRGAAIVSGGLCGPASDTHSPPVDLCEVYHVHIATDDDQALWSFDLIPGMYSSGSSGSGLELRDVKYRGVSVLRRAHVPILNVRYRNDSFGPYRDWLNEEHEFETIGQEVQPGFIECTQPPQTILESGTDTGNFKGIAMYRSGEEVVFVSEFKASWYRYKSEWRFHDDGTLQPRFGFTSTKSEAACEPRDHHVYWRLDFAIRTPENNRVREFNEPAINGLISPHVIEFETRREVDSSRQRRWLIENAITGEGYSLVPGRNDGRADAEYGVGDLWVLRTKEDENDDSTAGVIGPTSIWTMARIDGFVDGERVEDHDIVVWYAGHYNQPTADLPLSRHIVGPDLHPVNWVTIIPQA